jgi:AcrR family transcriptional regulator
MQRRKDTYHHGDLRNALVASALKLIEQGGQAEFSLREAARDVGVSANAAYRHFEDKSALMTAAAADGHERLARRMQRSMTAVRDSATEAPASIARFKAVGRAYVEFAADHPELFRLMFGECGAACLSGGVIDGGRETPWTLLGKALDALVADGLLRAENRPGAELKAWTVVHGFAALELDGTTALPRGRQRAAALEAVLEFAVVGLCGTTPRQAAQ